MKFCPSCGSDISMYLAAEDGRRAQEQDPKGFAPAPAPLPAPSSPPEPYNQDKIWKELVDRARARGSSPPTFGELIDPAIEAYKKRIWSTSEPVLDTIIHIVFDKPIVPTGGILLQAMRTDGQSNISVEQLEAWGYLVLDGKIVEADGVPVSPAYGALTYWGGEKQFKRWHLAGPIDVNPSRNGNPFFMDAEMLAFGAKWRDMLKMGEGLSNLLQLFTAGVNHDKPIAHPFALEIVPRR